MVLTHEERPLLPVAGVLMATLQVTIRILVAVAVQMPGPAAKGVLVGVVALMLPLPLTMAARILVAWGVKSPHSVPRN